jgi:ribosome recycling factor
VNIEATISDAEKRMVRAIEALTNELTRIRTGRAHPGLLDQVTVDYYGSEVPLTQVARVNIGDSRTLMVVPFEKPMLTVCDKAIRNANLGLNPVSAGESLRVALPPLTEDRRRELAKLCRSHAEDSRVAVRNVRRDANQALKDAVKKKLLSEDDERRAEERIQKLTDAYIKQVDQVVERKEKELMEV